MCTVVVDLIYSILKPLCCAVFNDETAKLSKFAQEQIEALIEANLKKMGELKIDMNTTEVKQISEGKVETGFLRLQRVYMMKVCV